MYFSNPSIQVSYDFCSFNALTAPIPSTIHEAFFGMDFDTTSYFFRVGKGRVFKKLLKQVLNVQLLDPLGKKRYLDDNDFDNIKEFIRTVLYAGKNNEDYIDTRIRLHTNLKTKSSMPLPPDPLSVIQVIKIAHLQAYTWYHCDTAVIMKLSLEDNGWLVNDDKIEPLQFVGCQLPPSSKLTKDDPIPQHESDADIDSDVEKPKRRRTRKRSIKSATKQVCEVGVDEVFTPVEFHLDETNDGGYEGDEDISSVITSTEGENDDDDSDWEVSDFASSGDSCDEWMP